MKKNNNTNHINLEYRDMPAGDVSFESRGIMDMDLGGASVGAYADVNDEDSNKHGTTVTQVYGCNDNIAKNRKSGGLGLRHSRCLVDDVVNCDVDLCDIDGACPQNLLVNSDIPDQDVAVIDSDSVDNVVIDDHDDQHHELSVWWPSAVLEGRSLNAVKNCEVKFAPDVSDELLILVEPSDVKVGRGRKVSAGIRRAALFDNFLGGLTLENAAVLVKKHGSTSLGFNMDDYEVYWT